MFLFSISDYFSFINGKLELQNSNSGVGLILYLDKYVYMNISLRFRLLTRPKSLSNNGRTKFNNATNKICFLKSKIKKNIVGFIYIYVYVYRYRIKPNPEVSI